MEPCGRKSSIRLPSYGRIQPCGSMSKQGCGAGYGRSKAQQQLGPIGRDEGPRPRYAPNGRRQGEAAQLILWSGVMCGIAGMIDWRAATSADTLRSIGEAMIETVRHRGPDAGDVWVEAEGGVVLGQRRLAIIDLSPGGAQPMHSADRRYVITFNGEIYNYRDIRRELQAAGRSMRRESDTEVLLEACALWGVEAALERAIGMFAFALWDRKTRSLVLARDRLGIKPLYYAATPERVIFASQLKAFRGTPGWKPTIDDDAVVGYLRHAYIAQPRTIYREARKLTPGHILTLREAAAPAVKCFWDLRDIAIAGERRNDPVPDANEAIERLDALLRDAVAQERIETLDSLVCIRHRIVASLPGNRDVAQIPKAFHRRRSGFAQRQDMAGREFSSFTIDSARLRDICMAQITDDSIIVDGRLPPGRATKCLEL